MVFFFTSRVPDWQIFIGENKEENELLLKYGFPEDIWYASKWSLPHSYRLMARFHVDNLSSTHLYIRMSRGSGIDDIPSIVFEDCLQLVKDNSIQGRKLASVDVVYTPWTNLKKTQEMVPGQVGFVDEALVRKVSVKKDRSILKVLERTRVRKDVDFEEQKRLRQELEKRELKELRECQMKERERIEREYKKKNNIMNYVGIFDDVNSMVCNKDVSDTTFEDFM